jgi:hypothetical protein
MLWAVERLKVITTNMHFFKISSIHRIREKRDLKSEYGNV